MSLKITFLASGNGGTLKFLFSAIRVLNLDFTITYVIADRECGALRFAGDNNIPNKLLHYTRNTPNQLLEELIVINPDLIITNIHKILDLEIVNTFKGRLVNLHYSLLPSFQGVIGMETIRLAKKANSGFIGASAHHVEEIVDAGRVISQSCFSIDWERDTNVENLIFRSACLCLLNSLFRFSRVQYTSKEELVMDGKKIMFSPPLSFETKVFDSQFWNTIAKI